MKNGYFFIATMAVITLTSCQDSDKKNTISQRYIHKFGYDVSHDEWESQKYPGQVVTTLRDGKSIVESYEDGMLHGVRTESFPHSQTVEIREEYERGTLKKRITHSVRGVPQKEELFKSPVHIIVTSWYPTGTPKSREEYKEETLISGQYYNIANETDSRVESGTGERTIRNATGDILQKEVFNNYAVTYVETYYPNNTPHTSVSFENGLIHGEKREFAMTGEPLLVENYNHGLKHGLTTYYQNGYKYLETPYVLGLKEGTERQYIDGELVAEETEYVEGVKHGSSVIYCDGSARTTWYFDNQKVSRAKFEQLMQRHEMVMGLNR